MPRLLATLVLSLVLVAPLAAQRPDSTVLTDSTVSTVCRGCPRRRPVLALVEVVAINIVVNRVDAWARNQGWAYVGPRDWSRNLRLGWEWDEDEFPTNMFAHPYHGALYFNAARSNGLKYWESVPYSFLGSWSWENLGEKFRPSLNDFFMTSFGGIALGEVTHRVGASVRDNTRRGAARIFREVASLPFDPMGGLNRLFRGDWSRVGPNPAEHDPEAFVFRLGVGARGTIDTGTVDTLTGGKTIVADLNYGDRYLTPFRAPFDVFSIRAQISPGGGGLNVLRASGRLYGKDITRQTGRHRNLFEINQRYDFANNPAYKFGGQSIEFGIASRFLMGKGYALRTDAFADAIFLGALDAPYTGLGKRTYDFGPGAGARFGVALERRGRTYISVTGRTEYVHTVSGAEADHLTSQGGTEITIPIARGFGVALHGVYFNRTSRYSGLPQDRREFPEARLLINWTTSSQRIVAPQSP